MLDRLTFAQSQPTVGAVLAVLGLTLFAPNPTFAGKLSWLDDVVREVVREAEVGGRSAVRGAGGEAKATLRGAGRLFTHEADEGLEALAKRSEDLARASRKVETAGEGLLQRRFARLLPHDPEAVRVFSALKPAEKRLAVEMGETAQRLARRYPGQSEEMIKALGTEGLTAVRVYGDDVAEVIVKEGPGSLGVLRKTGRGGWSFFKKEVLPHKKKLIAAGVLAAFLANPDRFVDYAGRATEYATREFSRAGIQLAGAVTSGASRGIEASIGEALGRYGLDSATARHVGMGLSGLVVVLATMVILGLPVAWLVRPLTWIFRRRSKARTVNGPGLVSKS